MRPWCGLRWGREVTQWVEELISGLQGRYAQSPRFKAPLHRSPNDDYDPSKHVEDLVSRASRRSGLILNADELTALVHLPTAAVRSKKPDGAQSKRGGAERPTRGDGGTLWKRMTTRGWSGRCFCPMRSELQPLPRPWWYREWQINSPGEACV